MKKRTFLQILATLIVGPVPVRAQGKASPEKLAPPAGLEPRLKRFFADKHEQAAALARKINEPLAPEIQDFLQAGTKGDWKTVAQNYWDSSVVGQTVRECYGAYDQFVNGEEKYVTIFAREILDSMPRGSIYFGGTDAGRCLPTAFCKSHAKADPVFVLTQSELVNSVYLKYLRASYGDRIATPTEEDSKKAFKDYADETEQRRKAGKLRPGEVVDEEGKVSGAIAMMEINGRLAELIFKSNPDREFFIEESFPLEWMYPRLAPHGLILKVHRQPLKELSAETARKDREYWMRFTDGALGEWLKPETPVQAVCDFARDVFGSKDLVAFKGDPKFVHNDYACRTFSKLRSSHASLYSGRFNKSASSEDKERMAKEADFAFRQAFALCPYGEVVFRYVNFLVQQRRKTEALLAAQTVARIGPANGQLDVMIQALERMK